MTDSRWTETLRWAKALADDIDLDAEERSYKLDVGDALADARSAVASDATDWPQRLQRALAKANFVNRFVLMRISEEAQDHREPFRGVLLRLWDDTDRLGAIGRFVEAVRPIHAALSTGNATTLASALLMAADATQYPPYQTRPVHALLDLVGLPRPDQDDPPARYQSMLDLLDELLARAQDAGLLIRDRLDAQGLMWAVLKYDPPSTWGKETRRAFRRWRGERVEEVEYERGVGKSQLVEEAAWAVMGPGLRGEPSVIDPALHTWRAETARELRRRIQGGDETSKDYFMIKLARQLMGAERSVVLLAAELLYLQVVPLSNIRPATRVTRIQDVLEFAEPPAVLPEHLVAGLETEGVFNGGTGFNVQIWQQLLWLCRFVEYWTTAPESARDAALTDPWAFRRLIAATPQDWPSIRLSMQYLAWPGYFENMVNRDHRRAVHTAFASAIGGTTGKDDESIDRDLHAIRTLLEEPEGHRIDWYESPYAEQWQKDTAKGQRAWLIRPHGPGAALVARWKDEGIVSLAAKHLGEVSPGAGLPDVRQAVEAGYEHLDYAQRLALASEYHAFLTKMQTDDVVTTIADGAMSVGVVLDEPAYVDDADTRLRRSVRWAPGVAVPFDELPPTLRTLLDSQGAVVDLTSGLELLLPLAEAGIGDPAETAVESRDVTDEVPALRNVTEEFARSLHLPVKALQEYVDLLQTRQQLVFYGPPGTGKTYLARALAHYLVGPDNASRVRLVQFHPSYSYEDFFEGFRPYETPSGQPSFQVTAGALRRLASEARTKGNSGEPFFLVIDEMNRGNIAKVFGELYFLLEYRNASVFLQYNPEEKFQLPKNLFIIGTMNTADRSIALVDAAIRRRFPFVELHPDRSPIEGLLREYLKRNKHDDERARLLETLNAAIEERDLRIGPSYLMRDGVETPGGLKRVWEYDILPLLVEHYYGRHSPEEVRERFGLDAIRAMAGPATDLAPPRGDLPEIALDHASDTPAEDGTGEPGA